MDESSFGIIPLRQSERGWEVLLVQLHAGHWGFPKGHSNEGEEPFATASRELFEETGLQVETLLSDNMFEESYRYLREGVQRDKNVGYFIAEVSGKLARQQLEVKDAKWVAWNEVEDFITFNELAALVGRVKSCFTPPGRPSSKDGAS